MGPCLARHSFVGGINDVVDRCGATNDEIGYTNSCRSGGGRRIRGHERSGLITPTTIVERFLDGRPRPEAVTDPLRSGGQAQLQG